MSPSHDANQRNEEFRHFAHHLLRCRMCKVCVVRLVTLAWSMFLGKGYCVQSVGELAAFLIAITNHYKTD